MPEPVLIVERRTVPRGFGQGSVREKRVRELKLGEDATKFESAKPGDKPSDWAEEEG